MTQEALNIAGQCRATASSPLAKNILVDEGNGLLTELLLDAARIIEALAQPEQEPVKWSDYEPDGMHHNKPQKRPQNCGTGYCSCIECVMEPPQRTEQEPLFKKIIDQHPGLAEELKALDEQEPVAWFSPSGNLYKTRFHATANGEQVVTPLYTTPPQRKPLTDEDLIECERLADIRHRKHMGSIRGQQLSLADQFLWHYARVIEAAHGIKE